MMTTKKYIKNIVFFALMFILFSKTIAYSYWEELEIVDKEEKEELSLFDRIDGKKPKIKTTYKKVYRWHSNENNPDEYVVDTYALIPVDTLLEPEKEGFAYKYYFDENGYLILDNITKDYHIVNSKGIEIDSDLKPIYYFIGVEPDSKEDVYIARKEETEFTGTPSQIIISPGVVIRDKVNRVFNNKIDKNMVNHIVGGSNYQNNVKGTIFTKATWNKSLSLRGNGANVVFDNIVNNFNKVKGKVAMEHILSSDRSTICKLIVYDKDLYDKGLIEDNIYECDKFNYDNFYEFSFTFDRRIKNLIFVLQIDGKYNSRVCFLKDLKFGFSKEEYKRLLDTIEDEKEEMENEEAWNRYIDSLIEMGVYTRDDSDLDIIDEDGELLDEIEELIEGDDDYYDYEDYHDDLTSRFSGPAFDEKLKNISDYPIGPYFDIVGTKSEIDNKKRKSKIIY